MEELINQVAIGTIDFDAIEAGLNSVLGCLNGVIYRLLDLRNVEFARCGVASVECNEARTGNFKSLFICNIRRCQSAERP